MNKIGEHGPKLSRRGLLVGAALGGGLIVAWMALPRDYEVPLAPGPGEYGFGAWLKIAANGVVTVAVPQLEMGQGITTILPQIAAVELGADWRQVAVQPTPPSGAYPNVPLAAQWAPLWMPFAASLASDPSSWPDSLIAGRWARSEAFAATASGTSLDAYEMPAREAAAAARAMLAMAAAERWDVTWEELEAENGFIIHGDRRLSFGELAEEAATFSPPDPPPLRSMPAQERPVALGPVEPSAFPRLDAPAKVDGTFQFAADVRLPGMVHASIRHGLLGRPILESFEEENTASVRGLVGVVRSKRWLAAVATNWWAAESALAVMNPRFSGPDPVDSERNREMLATAMETEEPLEVIRLGEGEFLRPSEYTARFEIEPAVHATLETTSVTARYRQGRLELWMAAQAPEAARRAAAKAIDLPLTDVVLYPMPAGGSFDARLTHIQAIEAAQLAQAVGKPVQLTWPRRQDVLGIPMRPPALIDIAVGMTGTDGGRIASWYERVAMPSVHHEFGARLFENKTPEAAIAEAGGEADAIMCRAAIPPYAIPEIAIDHVPVTLPLSCGPMRGGTGAITNFATECVIDELAGREGREPLSFRVAMLGGDPRMARLLREVAGLAQWDGGRRAGEPRSHGQGLACFRMELASEQGLSEGRIACIAEARPGPGGIEVAQLFAAVDIGRIVNIDIARQQIEGGLLFGMGLAVGCAPEIRNSVPQQTTLSELDVPRLANSPTIDVIFVASDAPAFDPGELGVGVVAPAIANAMYAATGTRLRSLPLTRNLAEFAPEPEPQPEPADATNGEEPAEIPPDEDTMSVEELDALNEGGFAADSTEPI
ncbi:molybdopterin-dependent oxidoreductase [Altererythrobacter aurantiacus]|uniref:Molybdopterin-dependent oxidoreductase n=1 Tax=Parapontixanthobacter aurantiacus TaxID=1463599 RepID=A0A844ZEK2_9SPHN|nr:molybdopterin cofactor-binding domain-containing protein [Parapontixanthobacter aurantiacus]MXO86951.1 molybdopterin-dependent oxidoreductase [Parapontixanthobacter aurantiacus]